MKFLVFDSDVESLTQWQHLTATSNLQFTGYRDLNSLENLLGRDETQIVLLDQSLVQTGFVEQLTTYCQRHRQHLFVATGKQLSIQQAVQIMRNRAAWVFVKPLVTGSIPTVLSCLRDDALAVASKLSEFRSLQTLFDRLTGRETQVLKLILNGTANKDSARELNISVRTVEARRAKVYHKIACDSIAELIRKVERYRRLQRRFTPVQEQPSHAYAPHWNNRLIEGHEAKQASPLE